jgi:YVTN family beta-propeller protein
VQVTRHRRSAGKHPFLGRITRSKLRLATASATALVLVATGTGLAYASTHGFGTDQVGTTTDKGLLVSDDQYVTPYGDRLVLNNGKIMSSTVSPDGTHLAATLADGSQALGIVNLQTKTVQQYISPGGSDVGQEGPAYSPDGTQLWVGRNNGYAKLTVNPDGTVSNPVMISIPAQGSKQALVGAAMFSPDGSTVYSAVNGQNTVVAINAATGAIEQTWAVGNAPRGLALVGGKLYVSNEGGRPARAGDTTINSYGTQVPASPFTGATTTGTVSVINLADPSAAPASINVGLHPTALYAKNGALFVTNTSSNTVSVIDTSRDKVVQTIATQPWPEASVGYEPNAVTLTGDGHLLVTLGAANAIAVYRYTSPRDPVSYVGLLPTDYFPAEITTVGATVMVSNTRGIDARRSTSNAHGTHDTTASLTWFTLPSDSVIWRETGQVFANNGWTPGSVQFARDHGHARPVPVPLRIGDPSTIKHVFLIVKENRTYDQQFGDIPSGNGDPSLTQFGENVTPNQHALALQFGLYDNFYDAGTNSAEGHNWLMQSDNPEYTQSLAGQYLRSYDTEDDALGHQRSGFIWTGAQAAGKTVTDFGEFQQFLTKPAGASWQNLYCDAKNMAATGASTAYPLVSTSPIPSLNNVSVTGFPKFDTSVPDIYRYQIWKQNFEQNGPSNLNMFWLSSDHTGGPPSPAAQVADNDLATGQIVDEISHSKYWKNSAIFVVEDDSQAGSDHVDGHRAPIQVISPWAQHGVVDNHYYTQITMIRTIEQILGIHPMNQKDSAASPMTAAFTSHPDYTPFTAVPNRTSLTAGLSTLPSCGANIPAPADPNAAPVPSTTVPASMKPLAALWATWQAHQHTTGPNAVPDFANPQQMNRYTWYQTTGWAKPYPGDTKIYAPSNVPGAYLPSSDSS